MSTTEQRLRQVRRRIAAAAGTAPIRLVAASKSQAARDIRALAGLGQLAFGENYVQEALAKQADLADLELEWHFIGPLQSNKAADVAAHFAWMQSMDRAKLVGLLDRHRPSGLPPLNVLVQVNIDAEASKSGCAPDVVASLCDRVAQAPRLRLRGLMSIPAPHPDTARRREAFARVHALFETHAGRYPEFDTLSIGMSDDFESAIAEGATMVRVGTALFGPRG